ncbi:MAG: hypothetical protein JST08_09145 [Actinobacteria bacterium]|nr:hypothetical protein [Actinomycetota bacterium]
MPNRVVAGNGGRLGIAALVVILLLGLGLRVGEAWSGRAPVYDAAAYAAIAKNLAEGNGFTVGARATQPSDDYSPGLPLFVAGVYKLTGGVHERLARLVLAVIGALAPLFAYLLARRLSQPTVLCNPMGDKGQGPPGRAVAAGLIAALAVAIYPATLEYTGMLMTEPLAATLLAGAILAILRAAEGASPWRWLVPGATLGALALVRPEYLAIGLLLALLVFLRQRLHVPWRRALVAAAVVALGIVVVIAPWTVRNAIALDRFVTISTGGGQVLFAGTYLPSDGNPERVGAAVVAEHPELFGPRAVENLRLEQILARLAERTHPGTEPDQALSAMGKEQLRDDIENHTGEYIGFVAAKIGRIWSHGPRAVMREPVWEALHWALLGLGLLGLALLAYRRRWEALLIGAVFLAVTLISALLVASPRRVLVLIPLLAACAGVAAVWLATEARALAGRGRSAGTGDQSVL